MVEAEPSTEVLSQAWNSSDLVHQQRINRSLVILTLLTRSVVLSVRERGGKGEIDYDTIKRKPSLHGHGGLLTVFASANIPSAEDFPPVRLK